MSEEKNNSVIDKSWGWLLSAIVAMVFVSLASNLVDRFVGNEKGWSFYAQDNDMTCQVMKSQGREHMFCLPGDHRVSAKETRHD